KMAGAAPYTKPVWICHTYNRFGRQACASRQIPENILERLSAEVLGMDRFDAAAFERQIASLRTIGRDRLAFEFMGGRHVIKPWQNDSRKWSEEQKERARQKRSETHE
ncbi:MAG: hypothetical protein IH607_04775, partial [Firmicutes bacterium]|nr:hypothetical protein [Bacillota bacterium]